MGSITFQVVGDASVGTKTKTFAVSDADINRFVSWAVAVYSVPGQTPLTTGQALLAWAVSKMDNLKKEVQSREIQQALEAVVLPTTITAA